jgi:hypoxanthine phosphoribosyltransferase
MTLKDIDNLYAKASLLYTKADIEAGLDRMAAAITEDMANTNPIVIGVMTGGLIPMGQLLTRLNFNLQIDYVHASRYQGEIQGGQIEWIAKPRMDLTNRTILLVDDILDAGVTLATIKQNFEAQGAREVKTAVLIDKRRARPEEGLQHADYVGLEVDDQFIFGYGLDYQGYFRNLAGIYMVNA